jgi:anti-anti-sigma factor
MLIEEVDFDIYKIKSIHSEFLELLKSGLNDFTIDLSKVEQIDLAAVQLLVSFKKSCEADGKRLKIINSNKEVLEYFQLCGCEGIVS